jgi:hypothetical protein
MLLDMPLNALNLLFGISLQPAAGCLVTYFSGINPLVELFQMSPKILVF